MDQSYESVVERNLPQTRPEECSSADDVTSVASLPSASLVLIWRQNETQTSLLRALHHVIKTDTDDVIRDVIVMNNGGNMTSVEDLKSYIDLIPKVGWRSLFLSTVDPQ